MDRHRVAAAWFSRWHAFWHRPTPRSVTVVLYDAFGSLVDETQTSADGAYEFRPEPGDYYLEFVAPVGDDFTSRDAGLDDTIDSDAAENGVTIVFSIAAIGSVDISRDAGLVTAPPAPETLVGDRVWLDADANGVQNGGENGVSGVTVNLYREPDPPTSPTPKASTASRSIPGRTTICLLRGVLHLPRSGS